MGHVPCDDIVKIKQELFGNGGPGLAAEFKEMYKEFQQWKGAINFIRWGVGLLGLGTIANLVISLAGK